MSSPKKSHKPKAKQAKGVKKKPTQAELDELLRYGCERGNLSTVKACLQHGADPCTRDATGASSIQWLVSPAIGLESGRKTHDTESRASCLRRIAKAGADTCERGENGRTPLHHAAASGLKRCVLALVNDLNADVNAVDDEGLTPLHAAMKIGLVSWTERLPEPHYPTINALLAVGANVNLGDKVEKMTPLMFALRENNTRLVTMFCRHPGSDLEVKALEGYTALHYAVYYGHPKCASILLRYGADVDARVEGGFTAYEVAEANLEDPATKASCMKVVETPDLADEEAMEEMTRVKMEVQSEGLLQLGAGPRTADRLATKKKEAAAAAEKARRRKAKREEEARKQKAIELARMYKKRNPTEQAAWDRHYRIVDIADVQDFTVVNTQIVNHPEVVALKEKNYRPPAPLTKEPEPLEFGPRKRRRVSVKKELDPDCILLSGSHVHLPVISNLSCAETQALEAEIRHNRYASRRRQQRQPSPVGAPGSVSMDTLRKAINKDVDPRVEVRQVFDPRNPINALPNAEDDVKPHYGLFAKNDLRRLGGVIKKGTILAEYGGEVLPYGYVWENTACFFAADGKVSAKDHEYQIDLKHSRKWAGTDEDNEKRVLCVDGRRFGNAMRMINDYRDERGRRTKERTQNVVYHESVVDGWPRIYLLVTRDIEADQEVLVDYGAQFWDAFMGVLREHSQLKDVFDQECVELLDSIETQAGQDGWLKALATHREAIVEQLTLVGAAPVSTSTVADEPSPVSSSPSAAAPGHLAS